LKYPQLIAGSLSGSSPVLADLSFYKYDQIARLALGEPCATLIHNATLLVEALLNNETSAQNVKGLFRCGDVQDNVAFLYVIADMVVFAAQYNSTYGIVPNLCKNFTTSTDLLQTYINYAHYALDFMGNTCSDWDISSFTNETNTNPNANMRQWMWQSCNEFGYFQVAPAENSLRSTQITIEWHLQVCQHLFNSPMNPKVDWTNSYYGGQKLVTSNTVFTNGDQDPWSTLSVMKDLGNSVPSIIMQGEAHCPNWRQASPRDAPTVTQGRKLTSSYFGAFIHGCQNNCNTHGVCMVEKDTDYSVSSKCACVSGWQGKACETSTSDIHDKEVIWWVVVVVGLVCIAAGVGVGYIVGFRRNPVREYSKL